MVMCAVLMYFACHIFAHLVGSSSLNGMECVPNRMHTTATTKRIGDACIGARCAACMARCRTMEVLPNSDGEWYAICRMNVGRNLVARLNFISHVPIEFRLHFLQRNIRDVELQALRITMTISSEGRISLFAIITKARDSHVVEQEVNGVTKRRQRTPSRVHERAIKAHLLLTE